MTIKTEKELAEMLGAYVAPKGLYKQTKEMSFLGKVSCNIEDIEAGSWHEVVLDYEVGASGIADGAWMKATFKFYSDWALFQTDNPQGANYVSAEYQASPLAEGQSPATVQSLKVRFDQKGHERPFQKAIIVDVVDGFIKPGDHIIIRMGDKRAGGPGTRVQTFVEKGFRFRCYVDPLGTSRFAAIPGDIEFDVKAGKPFKLLINGTRLIRKDEKPNLQLRAEDSWGNTCIGLGDEVEIIGTVDKKIVYEKKMSFPDKGWASLQLDDIDTSVVGELKMTAKLNHHFLVPSTDYYLTIDEFIASPVDVSRIYYGDLHVHSDDTVGTNDTIYNLSYGRDVAALDVLGYTANDFQITKKRWEDAVKLCRELSVEESFICYPGTEWCGNSCAGGDHNVVFLHDRGPKFPFDEKGNVVRSFEWNEDMAGDTLQPGAWPLEDLYTAYVDDPEGHLLMPHVGGRRCNLDWHHPELEKLAEIESAWGHFPWLYADAMRRGYKLGVSANGDEHRGRCGGGVPGTAVFGTKGGVTGIISSSLTREKIGTALRSRHTFATTGERLVGLTKCHDYIQGDEFVSRGPSKVEYRFLGDMGWDEIVAYDHQGILWSRNLQQEAGYSERKIRLRWGGARIKDRYRWANWNGKITIENGIINSFHAHGFEHSEENCWRTGALSVGFHSDTYGDADCIELDVSQLAMCKISVSGTIDGYVKVGNPLDGSPFSHCPKFNWEITGKELIDAGVLRIELGGAELFLAIERMSDEVMPREVTGVLDVLPINGPHGFRPVYFMGRQVDDAKVWTSAMFINFQ